MATVYQIVTNEIIKKLEAGTIPWRKPWRDPGAVNWKTQKPYRGINAILLDPGEYLTFKQVQEAGGKVKKGAKSHIVVFWKWLETENKETGELEKIPFLRYYRVFELSQTEGLKSRRKDTEVFNHNPIEAAEKIIEGYQSRPLITFAPGKAFYSPITDSISVPALSDYQKPEEYYSTLFHEAIHSTGHKTRLNRATLTEMAAFGSETYSKEELVAEIGAAMLCGTAGIENKTLENSAAYIQSWLRVLKKDSRMVVLAAGQAQKAADYILGYRELEQEPH
ncbi:ArdC family protein [Desulfotruncus alcoholivorax]|uniref:ArdC family protein n=1 Tax=Desulfotruncus alcoholivorax TaxID=265477 RepID=UPI0003FB35D4|nr:zincin-like metallopeptidase domain-containing protein [Desulfotruncus alcoholivorax]